MSSDTSNPQLWLRVGNKMVQDNLDGQWVWEPDHRNIVSRLAARVAELERDRATVMDAMGDAAPFAEECDRLRKALTEIRDSFDGCEGPIGCVGGACTWCLANKALAAGKA